jgi:AmmeMemoRadiSam system protein B
MFYPDDPHTLRATIDALLSAVPGRAAKPGAKALIVPHAGYIYSGPIAAAAYESLRERRHTLRRVVLIGPSHRVALRGIAVPSVAKFLTPLGAIDIDQAGKRALMDQGLVVEADAPHAMEHCLEVQLPFLQSLLDEFTLLPLVAGLAAPAHVARVLATVWGNDDTLVLVSSDLSHYHAYDVATGIDTQTAAAILRYDSNLAGEQACGAVGINGLTLLARERALPIAEIARCNSGDTAGDRKRVVGYGAFCVHEPAGT